MPLFASFYYEAPPSIIIAGGLLLGVALLYFLARTEEPFRGFICGGIGCGLIAGTVAALGSGDMAGAMALGGFIVFGIAGAIMGAMGALATYYIRKHRQEKRNSTPSSPLDASPESEGNNRVSGQ